MGSKYMIHYKNYDTDYWEDCYQTEWFIKAIIKLCFLKRKWECIDFTIRK